MSIPRPPSARAFAPHWAAPVRGLAFDRTRLNGPLDVDVAVIGSGLTAALAAAWLAREGLRVALVAAEAIGHESACGAGLVGVVPATSAADARAALGVRATRAIWGATRKAGSDLLATLTRWRTPCGLRRLPSYLIAADEGQAGALEREQAALEACGVKATWLGPARATDTLGLERTVALRLADADGVVDPVRATLACARAAAADGAAIAEGVTIDRVVRTKQGVELQAGRHRVSATTLVVATAALPAEYRAVRRHLTDLTVTTCVLAPLAAASRRRLGRPAMCEALGAPGLAWRPAPDGGLVITRSLPVDLDAADSRTVLGATGELMYDFSLRHPHVSGAQPTSRWLRPTLAGLDGLPVAGRHRAFPGHVFALARADRLAECALAARIAATSVIEGDHPAAGWLDFARLR